MTSDHDSLLQAILSDPADDTARLVYADWLDENGQPERAEFIRLQCKMARCRMCHRKDGSERKDSYSANCGRCKPGRARERELWHQLPTRKEFAPWSDAISTNPDLPHFFTIAADGEPPDQRRLLRDHHGNPSRAGPTGVCRG